MSTPVATALRRSSPVASALTRTMVCRNFSSAIGNETPAPGPLDGVRVVEVGNFIAGPYCGTMLGYFGAEVIKVEPPGGDQIRQFRDVDSTGTSWWWRGASRNKKSVCLDLKKPGAQAMVRDLVSKSDVIVENFKPGKMEEWGLGPDDLKTINSELVYSRISGYGQTGPYSRRPGFASACEAMGGIRYVNGFEDRPSVRPNLSLGDTLAGIHAALGTVMALYARQGAPGKGGDFYFYPNASPDPDPDSDPDRELDPEPEPDRDPDPDPETDPDSEPDPNPSPNPNPNPKPIPKPNPDPGSDSDSRH